VKSLVLDLRGALAPIVTKNRAAIIDPRAIGKLMRALEEYDGQPATALALKRRCGRSPDTPKFLFPSLRSPDRPMSNNTINAALRQLGYSTEEMTGHGFRAPAYRFSRRENPRSCRNRLIWPVLGQD